MSKWANEDAVVVHHSNTQASAMSVNASGDLVVLGSRRHLTIIELKEPQKVVRRIHLTNKWDISHLFWNSSPVNSNFLLTTYNQWADVWRFDEGVGNCLSQLQGHTRAISDADWSVVSPNLCATCSLDTYIYVWDVRDLKRHKFAISTVSGSSQVKWNKVNGNYISTAHDGNIRVWDIRNVKTATHYITAHLSKINHLDWDPGSESMLASAGQDSTIRLWNTTETPRKADLQIGLKYPVWKLSYTPFGSGLLSVELANFRETPLTMWNIHEPDQPVHSFTGHNDVVLGHKLVKSKNDPNWKLVTWCKDQTLQIRYLNYNLLFQCGMSRDTVDSFVEDEESYHFMNELPAEEEETVGSVPIAPNTMQSSNSSVESNLSVLPGSYKSGSHEFVNGSLESRFSEPFSMLKQQNFGPDSASMHSLEQEFKLLNVALPNLHMEEVDVQQRTCSLSLRSTVYSASIKISFPIRYPRNEMPLFVFTKSNLGSDDVAKLKQTLQETAQHHVRNNRNCLEPCLRQVTDLFADISYKSDDLTESFDPPPLSFAHTLRQHQMYAVTANVPFPRTSGARFCSVGYLVVFLRPAHVRGFQSNNEKTPRSFASLTTHRNSTPSVFPMYRSNSSALIQPSSVQFSTSPNQPDFSVSRFYYKVKRPSRKLKQFQRLQLFGKESEQPSSLINYETKLLKPQQYAGHVVINDLTRIMPVSRKLAEEYLIPDEKNFRNACLQNRVNATKEEMDDLVELWNCVSLLPKTQSLTENMESNGFFASTPMGKKFLNKLIQHYCHQYDVQTLAMLACTFASKPLQTTETKIVTDIKRSASYDTFRMKDRNPMERIEAGMHYFYSMIGRSPPNQSFMEHARSTTNSPTEQRPTILETKLKMPKPKKRGQNSTCMLEPSKQKQFDAFKNSYCDLLSRWKMNVKKAEIQKFSHVLPDQESSVVLKPGCTACGDMCMSNCTKNKSGFATCVICQLPVRNLFIFCNECMHGGHREHMLQWFKSERLCPSSCGCNCGNIIEMTK